MSKLPKEKRDKMILVGMVTIAASAAVWLLLINPQRQTLRTARADVEKSRDQLARGNSTLKTRTQVNEQFTEASRRLQQRETAMAAPNDMYSWFIQMLNNFRLPYKVEIPQFGRELPTEVGMFAKFPYRAAVFNVRGTACYHDFGKFLADFENTFPYIRVQNIELSSAGEGGGGNASLSNAGAGAGSSGGAEAHDKLDFKIELLTLVKPVAP